MRLTTALLMVAAATLLLSGATTEGERVEQVKVALSADQIDSSGQHIWRGLKSVNADENDERGLNSGVIKEFLLGSPASQAAKAAKKSQKQEFAGLLTNSDKLNVKMAEWWGQNLNSVAVYNKARDAGRSRNAASDIALRYSKYFDYQVLVRLNMYKTIARNDEELLKMAEWRAEGLTSRLVSKQAKLAGTPKDAVDKIVARYHAYLQKNPLPEQAKLFTSFLHDSKALDTQMRKWRERGVIPLRVNAQAREAGKTKEEAETIMMRYIDYRDKVIPQSKRTLL